MRTLFSSNPGANRAEANGIANLLYRDWPVNYSHCMFQKDSFYYNNKFVKELDWIWRPSFL